MARKKILIIGTSACGKTSLGKQIADLTGIEVTDLDDLYWLPNWTPKSDDDFIGDVKSILSKDSWIISGGNYSRLRNLTWGAADTIVWIDLPLRVLLWRAMKRSLGRIVTGETCCNGNYETLGRLLSKRSILFWIIKTYHRRKQTYGRAFSEICDRGRPQEFIKLTGKEEMNRFLSSLATVRD